MDTGHNFDEVLEFRDRQTVERRRPADVATVQDNIDAGRAVEEARPGARGTGCRRTLLRAIPESGVRRRLRRGPAGRGEGAGQGADLQLPRRIRAWDPKNQRPELWNLYNGRHRKGEHIRVFPLSNWTELDIWSTSGTRASTCRRSTSPIGARCSSATACSWRSPSISRPAEGEPVFEAMVRFRTIGDADCTGCVESMAETIDRHGRGGGHPADRAGATRADDRISEAGMEDRKREGYF